MSRRHAWTKRQIREESCRKKNIVQNQESSDRAKYKRVTTLTTNSLETPPPQNLPSNRGHTETYLHSPPKSWACAGGSWGVGTGLARCSAHGPLESPLYRPWGSSEWCSAGIPRTSYPCHPRWHRIEEPLRGPKSWLKFLRQSLNFTMTCVYQTVMNSSWNTFRE